MNPDFPCPGCGFLVYDETPGGSFATCPVCSWEDDDVQSADPFYQGGANDICLADHQQDVLTRFPVSLREHGGYGRDPQWRPVAIEE